VSETRLPSISYVISSHNRREAGAKPAPNAVWGRLSLLNSPVVRREAASRLAEQLGKNFARSTSGGKISKNRAGLPVRWSALCAINYLYQEL